MVTNFDKEWFDLYFNKHLFRDLGRESALLEQRVTGFLQDEKGGKFNPVLKQHDVNDLQTSFNDLIAKMGAPEKVQFITKFSMFAQGKRETPAAVKIGQEVKPPKKGP